MQYLNKACLWQAVDCKTSKIICSAHIWETCCKLAAMHGYDLQSDGGIKG